MNPRFKKGEIAIALRNMPPAITKKKKYRVLGVKVLKNGESHILLSADNKKRRYFDSVMFMTITEAISIEERKMTENIENKDF